MFASWFVKLINNKVDNFKRRHQVWLNIACWILIIFRWSFGLGDRIEWGAIQGDVIDIQLFYITLLEIGNWVEADQSTGRLVNVPNSNICKDSLFNFTHGFKYLWNEINIVITFASNWQKAEEQIKEISKRYMIKYTKFTPITYIDIKEKILARFKQEDDIKFTYPTHTVHKVEEDKGLN